MAKGKYKGNRRFGNRRGVTAFNESGMQALLDGPVRGGGFTVEPIPGYSHQENGSAVREAQTPKTNGEVRSSEGEGRTGRKER